MPLGLEDGPLIPVGGVGLGLAGTGTPVPAAGQGLGLQSWPIERDWPGTEAEVPGNLGESTIFYLKCKQKWSILYQRHFI